MESLKTQVETLTEAARNFSKNVLNVLRLSCLYRSVPVLLYKHNNISRTLFLKVCFHCIWWMLDQY